MGECRFNSYTPATGEIAYWGMRLASSPEYVGSIPTRPTTDKSRAIVACFFIQMCADPDSRYHDMHVGRERMCQRMMIVPPVDDTVFSQNA